MQSLNWEEISTVFLDMDGTLLDLHFDNYFWLTHLPQRYAGMTSRNVEQVRKELMQRMQKVYGSLDWYCLDFWSDALDVDIVALKREVTNRIAVFPHVIEFLAAAQDHDVRLVLLTNAHRDSLALKLEHVSIGGYFDRLISSHDLGIAKEGVGFWNKLQALEPFEQQRTLLVDDNLAVLKAAREYGVGYLYGVASPDSKKPPLEAHEFPMIKDFRDLGTF